MSNFFPYTIIPCGIITSLDFLVALHTSHQPKVMSLAMRNFTLILFLHCVSFFYLQYNSQNFFQAPKQRGRLQFFDSSHGGGGGGGGAISFLSDSELFAYEVFGVFWNLLEFFEIFWNLLNDFRIFQNILDCFRIFQNVAESLGFFRIFGIFLESSGLFQNFLILGVALSAQDLSSLELLSNLLGVL